MDVDGTRINVNIYEVKAKHWIKLCSGISTDIDKNMQNSGLHNTNVKIQLK